MMIASRWTLDTRKKLVGRLKSFRRFKFKNGEVVSGSGVGMKNSGISIFGVGYESTRNKRCACTYYSFV